MTGIEKLKHDLGILEAMAAEMDSYLMSDVLFWRLGGRMPMLTLGGYLMRQHRLLALPDLLDDEERVRLQTTVSQFKDAITEKIVRLEEKVHDELDARIRQWEAYLKELDEDEGRGKGSYSTAVEARVMIKELIDLMQQAPYRLRPRVPPLVNMLDVQLRRLWQPRDTLVWATEWKPAYPRDTYWWLHGQPAG